jgi:hypothetical protein
LQVNRCRATTGVGLECRACAPAIAIAIAIAQELDSGAVHHKVQRSIGAPIRDQDNHGLLPVAQGRVIQHRPIQVRPLEQARHHPGRLPQRQLEQNLVLSLRKQRRLIPLTPAMKPSKP